MSKVVIIHGWADDPSKGWLGWLKTELENGGHNVLAPQLPNPKEPDRFEWMEAFTAAVGAVDTDTYFVAHSLGGQVLLRFLEQLEDEVQVGGVLFVATRCTIDESIVAGDNVPIWRHTWVGNERDFKKIRNHLPENGVHAILSDNDYYISVTVAEEFKQLLSAEVTLLHNRGHFMRERDGCTKLPEVRTMLLELIGQTDP